LPCLGLDHDGADRNGNKLLQGTLDQKEAAHSKREPRTAAEMKPSAAAVRCGVWRGVSCVSWPGVWDFILELDCGRSAIAQRGGVRGY
jgi:hypothetical protein